MMKFLIIIPVHNEEQNIGYCLQSLEQQSFQNFEIIVVNDGSTDKTLQKIEDFYEKSIIKDKIKVINRENSVHQPGAKVVRAFNTGLDSANLEDFDIICKFDADIIFPKNYLYEVEKTYQEKPSVGMVSGLVKIRKNAISEQDIFNFSNPNKDWIFENISSKKHIRGPIKSYRKECFQQMKGLRQVLGWDNLDVLLARKNGWKIFAIQHLWVKHLRPTAFQYKHQKAEKLGEYFYNIGLSFPLAMVSAIKASWKSKSITECFLIIKSFLNQKHDIALTKDEIQFIRNLKWKEMGKKIFKMKN